MIAKAESSEFTGNMKSETDLRFNLPFDQIEKLVRRIVAGSLTSLIVALPFIGLVAGWAVNIFRWVTGL